MHTHHGNLKASKLWIAHFYKKKLTHGARNFKELNSESSNYKFYYLNVANMCSRIWLESFENCTRRRNLLSHMQCAML